MKKHLPCLPDTPPHRDHDHSSHVPMLNIRLFDPYRDVVFLHLICSTDYVMPAASFMMARAINDNPIVITYLHGIYNRNISVDESVFHVLLNDKNVSLTLSSEYEKF